MTTTIEPSVTTGPIAGSGKALLWDYGYVERSMLAEFKKRFNAEPTEIVNTVAAYDLIQWVADSIKRAGKAEGPAVRDAIESAKDLKLLHFTLTLDKATHNPLNKPAAMMLWKNQLFNFLEMWAPQDKF